MKRGTEAYAAALDATVTILQQWAREGRTGWYSALSAELKELDHPVHHRSKTMSELLEDACRREYSNGGLMLSAIVVNKVGGKPSGQFFELAKTSPFHRTDPGWTWEDERDCVFAHYSTIRRS